MKQIELLESERDFIQNIADKMRTCQATIVMLSDINENARQQMFKYVRKWYNLPDETDMSINHKEGVVTILYQPDIPEQENDDEQENTQEPQRIEHRWEACDGCPELPECDDPPCPVAENEDEIAQLEKDRENGEED